MIAQRLSAALLTTLLVLQAAPLAAAAENLQDTTRAICGAWDGSIPKAACVVGEVRFHAPTCGVVEQEYRCTIPFEAIARLAGPGCAAAHPNFDADAGWGVLVCGVFYSGSYSAPTASHTISNIPPEGRDVTVTGTVCVAWGHDGWGTLDPGRMSCNTWTVGRVHLPGPPA